MANYSTPGVYIEEISTLGSSVASVPTAVPGFTGYTFGAPVINGTAWNFADGPSPPVRVTSMLEFQQIFGGPKTETFTITLTGANATPTIAPSVTLSQFILFYQVQMFYANGGGACHVVSAGNYGGGTIDWTKLRDGIDKFEQIDEVTLLVTPETVFTGANMLDLNNRMTTQCFNLQDRFAIMDTIHDIGNTIADDASDFRNSAVGADNLKYGATYYPALLTSIEYAYLDADTVIVDNRTIPVYTIPNNKLSIVLNGGAVPADKTLYNSIKAVLAKYKLSLYPSASMAGVYARVDAGRGVWKAPANVGLSAVTGPSILVTDEEQKNLNIDSVSGKSINVIRQFTGRGTLVWGARTLAGNDNEWKYINVRRLFTYVEESIKKATEFVVFESNTSSTWQRVKSMSEAFLTSLWRDGALAGATTKDAFFVRVGLGTTMTPDDILNGRMIVEIGMAASRPAEFIILRFSHKLQES